MGRNAAAPAQWRLCAPQLVSPACLLLLVAAAHASGLAVVAENPTGDQVSLGEALKRPDVSKIILASDVSFANAAQKNGEPFRLDRNLTIASQDPTDPRVIDFGFLRNQLSLCSACVLHLYGVALTNDRKGNGASIDFIIGDPWARVLLDNSVRWRTACIDAATGVPQTLTFLRSPAFPGKQAASVSDFSIRGRAYPGTFHAHNVAIRVDRASLEGIGWTGGYDMLLINMSRPCDRYVDKACLQSNTADVCVAQLMDEALEGGRAAGPAAIAAPVAVCGALLVAAAAGVLMWRRRLRRERLATELASAQKAMSGGGGGPGLPSGSRPGPDTGSGWRLLCEVSCHDARKASPHGAAGPGGGPLPGSNGSSTEEPLGDIRFGSLLGAGSFGRVYRATWRGLDCAVKVIDHADGAEAADVANEARLLLSLDHPNVVKAYHFVQCARADGSGAGAPAAPAAANRSCVGASRLAAAAAPTSSSPSESNGTGAGASSGVRSSGGANGGGPGGGGAGGGRPGPGGGGVGGSDPDSFAGTPSTLGSRFSHLIVMGGSKVDSFWQQHVHSAVARAAGRDASAETGAAGSPRGAATATAAAASARTYIVQQYCDGGSLSDAMRRLGDVTGFGSPEFKMILLALLEDAARGLAYTHGRHVVHGDLNARNVLVSRTEDPNSFGMVAQISDFGLSHIVTTTHRTTQTYGTMTHMAPERLTKGSMSSAGDTYAFGIMMWELWTGTSAFQGLHFGQVCSEVVVQDNRPEVPPGAPPGYAQLMRDCWGKDPAARPPMEDVRRRLEELLEECTASLQPAGPGGPAAGAGGATGAAGAAAAAGAAGEVRRDVAGDEAA